MSSATKQIEAALKNLNGVRGSAYTPKKMASYDYGAMLKKMELPDFSQFEPIDWTVGKEFDYGKDKKSKGKKVNIWDVLTGTLGQPGGFMTDMLHNQVSAVEAFKKDKDPWYKKAPGFLLDVNTSSAQSLAKNIAGGAKEQWKDWTDGEASWGDVPGVGFLHGADKAMKRGHDVMDKTDMKDGWQKTALGIGIDIAYDPLTYLTGGASLATKAGKTAEIAKMAELAGSVGLSGKKFKNANEFLNAATDVAKKKFSKSPHIAEHVADKAIAKEIAKLADQIKTARSGAYNTNINKWGASVPFSNKASVALGDIGKKNLLYRSEAKVTKALVNNFIGKATKGNSVHASQLAKAVQERYGVTDFAEMTKTQFDDLSKKLKPLIDKQYKNIPDAKVTEKMVDKNMVNELFDIKTKKGRPNEKVTYARTNVDDILKTIEPRVAEKIEPLLRGLGDVNDIRKLAPDAVDLFGELAPKIMRTVKGKTADDVLNAFHKAAEQLRKVTHTATLAHEPDIAYKVYQRTVEILAKGDQELKALKGSKDFYKSIAELKANPFNEMMKGRTNFEHWLDKKNPFDARTLKTGDAFVNSMGNHIADASSQRVGELAQYKRSLNAVEAFIKKAGGTAAEKATMMKEAIYHLEGHAPKAYGKDWVASPVVQQLSDLVKPILDDVKAKEMDAGVLTNVRNKYFPHVVNKTNADLKKIREFKDRHGDLKGLNKNSKNNKTRSSFQTMAQRDDYMVKLDKLIRAETDEVAKDLLQKQLDEVTDLFDTDIVSALTRRIREGIRAKSMKAMHGELSKFGMMVSDPKDASDFIGLRKLEPSEAKKLGLEEGVPHYMHDDVIKGMKRVDEMFTTDGMNKTMRALNATTDIWRSLVTSYKPSHYRNNIIGNVINNLAAGVNPNDYTKANRLMKAAKNGTLTHSEKKIMDAAYKHNVVSGGFLTDDHGGFHFTDPTKLEKVAHKVSNNRAIKKVRGAVGEKIDDVSRLANFINGVNKYGDNEKAALQVREYLFNYNEMTDADRMVRMAVPFWNWTKRNVPLQVKLLMEQPKVAMNVERFQNLFNDEREGAEWQKESGIKLPGTDYYTSLPSPTKDLNLLLNPLSFLSSISPVPKMGTEIAMNRKFFTQKPISYGEDSTQIEDLPEYFAKNFGITGNIWDAATGKKGIGESIVNSVNPIYGVQEN